MTMFRYALTRQPAPDFAQGITTSQLGKPDYSKMLAQHAAYEEALRSLGLEIIHLEALEGYPDAYFVEDTAVVLPELAVITRPGARARQGEETSIAAALAAYHPLTHIQPPGTLEGGDIFVIGKHLYIGLSERTNLAGAEQLAAFAAPHGYQSTFVPVGAGLHLKSSANPLSPDTLLITQEFASREEFTSFNKIILHPEEAYAANTLWLNDHLITPAGFPRTREQLEKLGLPVMELDVSEVQKMDGGLTCMSLRF
jgi:dimethylargininase